MITGNMKIIEPDGNWKVFLEAKDSDYILLQHVTSVENAKHIMKNGFTYSEKNWRDSEDGYIYFVSGSYGLGTYMHHSKNAIVDTLIRKDLLLPDDKSGEWKSFITNPQNKSELMSENVNLEQVTAFNTFKLIGQVKSKFKDAIPYRVREL